MRWRRDGLYWLAFICLAFYLARASFGLSPVQENLLREKLTLLVDTLGELQSENNSLEMQLIEREKSYAELSQISIENENLLEASRTRIESLEKTINENESSIRNLQTEIETISSALSESEVSRIALEDSLKSVSTSYRRDLIRVGVISGGICLTVGVGIALIVYFLGK